MTLVQGLAFETLATRLSRCLIRHAKAAGTISITHQELAAELGCTREVISRQLKDFEKRSWITLSRGLIEIIDQDGLERSR